MTEEIDWSLPARLRRIAQVFGDALNVEAADRIELLERELNAWKTGAHAEQRRAIRAEDALHAPPSAIEENADTELAEQRDAARYRWLRLNNANMIGDALDAAVDAAIHRADDGAKA